MPNSHGVRPVMDDIKDQEDQRFLDTVDRMLGTGTPEPGTTPITPAMCEEAIRQATSPAEYDLHDYVGSCAEPESERPVPTENDKLRERSGTVRSCDRLTAFLYDLMKCHVPPGVVERLLNESPADQEFVFSNGWLAQYAIDVAARLRANDECELFIPKIGEPGTPKDAEAQEQP